MIRHRSPQDGRPGRFVPRVEALEDRCVPACNFIVRGSTLLVTAPAGTTPTNDTVILSDNGGNAANNVVGFCRAPFFPNVPISNIQVLTGTGDERVVYNLVGDLTNARTVNVNFGSGNDRFLATLRRNIFTGGSLSLNVNGGPGNDRLEAILIGSLGTGAQLGINFNGNGGDNTVRVTSATFVNVAAGAALNINENGGAGASHVFSDYEGVLNGTYTVNARGGQASSSVFAEIDLAFNSTGRVGPSSVLGGPGDDTLTFIVRNPGPPALTLNNILDGGGGFDTSVRTNNVAP